MKIKQDIDLGQIASTLVFVGALIGWGIDMERRLTRANTSVEAMERVQKVRWEDNNRRLDNLNRDLITLENRMREDED